jgi:hypothetical protein
VNVEPMRRIFIALLASLLCHGAAARYPARPIRLLVPIPPGWRTASAATATSPESWSQNRLPRDRPRKSVVSALRATVVGYAP